MENLDIKDIAEACTEKTSSTPYVDWAAKSSGISTNDPFDAIIPQSIISREKAGPLTSWHCIKRSTANSSATHTSEN